MLAVLFLLLTLLFVAIFYFALKKDKVFLLPYGVWLLVIGVLAFMEVFLNNPKLFLFILVSTLIINYAIFKRIKFIKVNPRILLIIQCLRIPVELILYNLFLSKSIPEIMTFNGLNFDILFGFLAIVLLVASLIKDSIFQNLLFKIWNGLGIISVAFVVLLAILSSPIPIQQFGIDQPNVALLSFPYCYLPVIIVPIVVLSHIMTFRQLFYDFSRDKKRCDLKNTKISELYT
ncbi:hypothetical protein [Sphingobacterium faecium]|jgi:uncharacterized protein (DUF433 family)|uniref:hypothetical protein n=1 Tax=Sphingobacterium faecium TaxID=34087 RepID=UPI00320A5B12